MRNYVRHNIPRRVLFRELRGLQRVYRHVSVHEVLALWWRRLALRGNKILPRRAPPPLVNRPRIVFSLTTVPSRIGRINRVLNSLIDQTFPADDLLLAIPFHSRREKKEYLIPPMIAAADAVTIIRCDDLGPATKLLPALRHESDPQTLIIAVDDDTVCPPDLVENLLFWHRRCPSAVLGYRGWKVADSFEFDQAEFVYATEIELPVKVDVVTGTWGLMVQPRFFDESVFDFESYPREAFYVDDVWFNGHLARRRVPRFIVPCRKPPMSSVLTRVQGLTFHENRDGKNDEIVTRAFAEFWNRKDA